MPKTRFTPPALGRPQEDRPIAPLHAAVQVDGPRSLPTALSLPIEQIAPDPDQPRRDQAAESLTELAASLTEYGVLQPLLVREVGPLDDGRMRYMIVAGGRRYAAALLAGLTRLPVVVRDTEGAALRLTQLVENIQRQDLAPLEEARAFQELMDAEGLNAEELGARLHISGQQIRERIRLLSDQVLADAVERGQITPSVARSVQRLPDAEREVLRGRVDAGEELRLTEVQEVKARSAAAGIKNPRAKGGGRGRGSRGTHVDQALLDAGKATEHPVDQALLDSTGDKPYIGRNFPEASPLAQRVYSAFQAWQADLDRALPQLSPQEAQELRGVLRAEVERLLGFLVEGWEA